MPANAVITCVGRAGIVVAALIIGRALVTNVKLFIATARTWTRAAGANAQRASVGHSAIELIIAR